MSKTIPQLDPVTSLSPSNKIEVSQSDSSSAESKYTTLEMLVGDIVNTEAQLASTSQVTGLDAALAEIDLQKAYENSATYPDAEIIIPGGGTISMTSGGDTAFGVDDSGIFSEIGLSLNPDNGNEELAFLRVGDSGAIIQVVSTLRGSKAHPDMTTAQRDAIVGQKPVGMGIYNIQQNTLQFWTTDNTWVSMVDDQYNQTIGGIKTFSSGIIGNISGIATQANTVSTTQTTTNATYYPAFFSSSTNGYQTNNLSTSLTFNPNTNVLSTTGLNLTGLTASVGVFTNGTSNLTSTGTLPFSQGGLGFTTATTGDLFYASATNTPNKLADVATGQVLTSGGVGAAPVYSASPSLTSLTLTTSGADALLFSGSAISGTNSVIKFSNTLGDGRHIDFGLSGRSMAVLSNGALAMTYGLNYSASANGYLYAFTGVPACAIELSNTNGFLKYVASGTVNNTATPSIALNWDNATGLVSIPTKLAIGTSQTQAVTNAISIRGTNSTSESAVNWFTSADQYPIFQLMPYAHNNTSYSMDAYYDGSAWKSSFATSSFQISKFQNNLDINYGVAAVGATVSWGTAFRISSTGDISLPILGKTLTYKTGTNAASGTVTLSGATTTVNTSAATTGDLIIFTVSAPGGTQGLLSYTISTGTSFTITSTLGVLDTSTVEWLIIHRN